MTEQAHTPGDWHTHEGFYDAGERPCITIHAKYEREGEFHHHVIADVYQLTCIRGGYLIDEATMKANAAFIASAPRLKRDRDRLLTALRDMLHHFCGSGEQTQSDAEVMAEAQAVIAAAEHGPKGWEHVLRRVDTAIADAERGSHD